MTFVLVRKLLRDLRLGLVVVAILLAAFQCLWAKIADKLSGGLLPLLAWLGAGRAVAPEQLQEAIFEGPGRILQSLLGGSDISLFRPADMLSVSYVHPLMQAIFCIWAIGRGSGAITGEIDRGTMELLLAQPLPRSRLILAHFVVDVLTVPVLCLSLWAGNWLGAWLVGILELGVGRDSGRLAVDPFIYAPALLSVAALIFAIEGYSLWLSARGRFRGRVLGTVVLITLVQFLINVIGQLWDTVEPLRPFTVFYYYQPQAMILDPHWAENGVVWLRLLVLGAVGLSGYLLAAWTFCRRDLPAPL
jgi:ABC-2 type transport system permease protein